MIIRTIVRAAVLIIFSGMGFAEDAGGDLAFGYAYGTAGFFSGVVGSSITEAPAVVLVFTSSKGQKSLVLTEQNGDYFILLEQERYCLTAFTQGGKPMQLDKNQLKCMEVRVGKETRLDVMLVRQ